MPFCSFRSTEHGQLTTVILQLQIIIECVISNWNTTKKEINCNLNKDKSLSMSCSCFKILVPIQFALLSCKMQIRGKCASHLTKVSKRKSVNLQNGNLLKFNYRFLPTSFAFPFNHVTKKMNFRSSSSTANLIKRRIQK